MNKDGGLVLRKNKVWFAGKLGVKAEPQSRTMQETAYKDLWFRVLATNARHHPASRSSINDVRHPQAASRDFCFGSSGSISSKIRGFMTLATSRITGMTTLLPNCL